MPELLIRVVSKVNPNDLYLDCGCTKRGDVIVVQPDDWPWGTKELTNPDWRILRALGVSMEAVSVFLAAEPERDPTQPSRTRQRRAFRFNLDDTTTLPGPVRNWLRDDSRAQPIRQISISESQLEALKLAVEPIEDPNVIGVSPVIF